MPHEGPGDNLGDLDWSNTNRKGQTSLDHVQKHANPNYQREMHGVFNGDTQTIIEIAWDNRANAKIVSDGMGERFITFHMKMQDIIQDILILVKAWIM